MIRESAWCPIQGLSRDEALALEGLGKELSATISHGGTDEGDQDQAGTSLIQCRFGTSGNWEVRVSDAVGLIGAGAKSWPVEPKIRTDHLLHLLERAEVLPAKSEMVSAEMESGVNFWDLVFDWFLSATEKLVRGDLARGYQHHARDLPFVRGSIDALSLSRSLMRGRSAIRCTFEEFTVDIPTNRLVKSALIHGLVSGKLRPAAARRARRLLTRFAAVSSATFSDGPVLIERNTRRYVEVVALARHILKGELRELALGSARAWCFLWRTPLAVESAIREVLRHGLRGLMPVSNPVHHHPPLRFRPDLSFGDVAVGDVKYAIDTGRWRPADYYQLLAFTVAAACRRALLVNFGDATPHQSSVVVSGTQLKRFSWRLDMPPNEAEQLLVSEVLDWLTAGRFPSGQLAQLRDRPYIEPWVPICDDQ